MSWTCKPGVIVAADWSARDEHRVACRAVLHRGKYRVSAPKVVEDSQGFLQSVKVAPSGGGGALVGFDFPIGLPSAYAHKAGIRQFREALGEYGHGEWAKFYQVSSRPSPNQPFYPLPTNQPGQVSRKVLMKALEVQEWNDLLRVCERKTGDRNAASCLFWTLGGNQVGKAACHGWEHVLAPALKKIKLWPFDGTLIELMSPGQTVVAEIYPAEACAQMGIRFGQGSGLSKRRKLDRQGTAKTIETWIQDLHLPMTLEFEARDALLGGFVSDDHYDAFVGLLSMIAVVDSKVAQYEPDDVNVRNIEGWILGQKWVADILNPAQSRAMVHHPHVMGQPGTRRVQ